eukprot:6169441-Karenia_brevis.AAC.1
MKKYDAAMLTSSLAKNEVVVITDEEKSAMFSEVITTRIGSFSATFQKTFTTSSQGLGRELLFKSKGGELLTSAVPSEAGERS